MISEKTVELNLSMELINHINFQNNLSLFSVAPSQRQEATLGYDVEIGVGTGSGLLIQYKRAIPVNNEYVYHINYTTNQDQHRILLDAENNGFMVLYAFPLFHTVNQIATNRRRLLKETAWYKPSDIILPGGPVGRHSLHIDRTKGIYYVTSEPLPIKPPMDFRMVNEIFQKFKGNDTSKMKELVTFLNSSISNEIKSEQKLNNEKIDIETWDTLSQQFILTLGI